MISLDGLRSDLLRRPDDFRLKIPTLRRLVASGASAKEVESVYPSTTYPAHATLVTGVHPKVHGIYSHLDSRDPSAKARPWHWFARAIRVPTLWDIARAAGLKTGNVGWPVSAGAAIDYNIPEIWDPHLANPGSDFGAVARNSTPGLFAEVMPVLAQLPPDAPHDRLRIEAALYIWGQHRPELLLIHLVDYDTMAHKFGPLSKEALQALEQSDEQVARVQAAVGEAVNLVVLSDHGFVPVEKDAAPQIILAEEGLFGRNADGTLALKKLGAIHAGGSFAIYWLKKPNADERRALARALDRITATGVVAEIVDRKKLRALIADPDAKLMLDAADGFYFSDRAEGPIVTDRVEDRGTHGHLPTRPGLEASFVAVGPGVRHAKDLGRISLTQVAPTLAQLLRLPSKALASRAQPLNLS